jgi:hypothetical protein
MRNKQLKAKQRENLKDNGNVRYARLSTPRKWQCAQHVKHWHLWKQIFRKLSLWRRKKKRKREGLMSLMNNKSQALPFKMRQSKTFSSGTLE